MSTRASVLLSSMLSSRRTTVGGSALLLLAAVLPVAGPLAAPPASAATVCSLVASPTGSDASSGAEATPFRTAQRLIDALGAGQTGCLRAGTYAGSLRFNHGGATGAPLELTSYPGERATVVGRLFIPSGSNSVTVSGLSLDGRNASGLPSPTVNSSDVTFRGNDVTNQHTGICFSLGEAGWGRAVRTIIERNRIHGCGRLPATNYDHGIYNDESSDVTIAWNLIYDNADRGIQLYPDAQSSTIVHNVIDGNGEGIIFSGDFGLASSNIIVANNVISNAMVRAAVESWYPTGNPVGQNNVVRDNCLWGPRLLDLSGGGFTAQTNTTADPQFANRAGGDFRMPSSSPCAAIAGDVQAAVDGLAPATSPDPAPAPIAVTASPSAASVLTGRWLSGTAADLAGADVDYYSVGPTTNGKRNRPPAFNAIFSTVPTALSNLRLAYRGKASTQCTQTVSLYRFSTGAWMDLDTRTATVQDQTISGLVPPGTSSEYVSSSGEVFSRAGCTSSLSTYTLSANQIQLTYDRP